MLFISANCICFCIGVQISLHVYDSYLLHILHPLSHLLVAHVIDILDEGIVLLPEGHPEAATLRGCNKGGSTLFFIRDGFFRSPPGWMRVLRESAPRTEAGPSPGPR